MYNVFATTKKEEERKRKSILSKEKVIRQLNRYTDVELSY